MTVETRTVTADDLLRMPDDGLVSELVDGGGMDWLRAGARMVIVVDPSEKTATVHHSLTEVTLLSIDDSLEGGTIVPGWTVPLREVFER